MSVASPTEPLNKTTMNNKSIIIIGAIAVIALLGVVLLALRGPETAAPVAASFGAVSNTNAPAAGTVLANGQLLPNPSVFDYIVARAFLYTDKAFGYGNTSGTPILEQGVRQVMATASSTPCALQSPFTTATSTFQNLSAQITVGTSTAGLFSVGTSTTAYATSTSIGTGGFAANAQGTMTFAGSANNNIIAPGQYITFGVQGVPYGYSYTGSCKGIFVSTQ